MILTVVGQSRRGHGPVSAVVAGMLFPLTWIAWYVRDEHPYGTPRHH